MAMILVHEKPYKARDLARVRFADYIRDLVAMLRGTAKSPCRGTWLRP
jgi:two-component sensor histidine kinase